MKRPLCIATVFFIIGIIIGLYVNISIIFFIVLIFILTCIYYYIFRKNKYIIIILFLILGFTLVKATDIKYNKQYNSFKSEEYEIKATIVEDAIKKEYKDSYKIKILEINGSKKFKNTYWILNIKHNKKTNERLILEYGDFIEFKGNIEIPSEARNYMGYDYKSYLKSQKILGNINSNKTVKIISKNNVNILEKSFYLCAKDIKNRMYKILPSEVKEICVGILIGDREDISQDIKEDFRKSNLSHILAVSGAHVSYVILGISIALNKLNKKVSKIFVILFLLFFMGLTKFTPSVERASIMSIMILVANILNKKSDVYTNLALSAIIILISNPYSIIDIGFLLSYGGTIGIILFNEKIFDFLKEKLKLDNKKESYGRKVLKYIIQMLSVTIAANIIIIPIMSFNFNTISLTFCLSNILAAPLLGIITIGGFFTYFISIFSIPFAKFISFPLQLLLKILIYIAKFSSRIPFSTIIVKTPYIIEILIYYFFVYIIFYFKYMKSKYNISKRIVIIIITSIIIIYSVTNVLNNSVLKIYFVDVGQGDCTLITTKTNKVILIDGGGSENSNNFDIGKQVLFPYILDRRIMKIDYMMISHFDSDHVGGLLYILENMSVKNVIISKQGKDSENYRKFKDIIKKKKINVIIAKKDEKIQIDRDTYFLILFPENELISENVLNNNSIVAKLCYKQFSILFTGDIEAIAEKRLLELYKGTNKLQSDILKVAHHGSKSSSIKEFLQDVRPKIALIGVGNKNTFGHPNEEVIERLENLGVQVFRTDNNGEIEVNVNKKGKVKIRKRIGNR